MARNRDSAHPLTPLVIGVTGHRDLVPGEFDELNRLIAGLFDELRSKFPHTPLRLMTALAEGADRLAAHVAKRAGVDIQAVLPMPLSAYREDFQSEDSRAEFDALCADADLLELPTTDEQDDALRVSGPGRDALYANAGMFISAHCHILLALWDGVRSERLGGTSQIIYFQHYDRLPGVAESVPRTSLFLTDDESDLAYHILCSRQGQPDASVSSPRATWFTTDPDAPHMETMPERYIRVFARTDEYNRDILRFAAAGRTFESSESEPPATSTQAAAVQIRQHFDTADTLANHFQKQVERTLAAIYVLAVLTGLSFVLYSELDLAAPLIFGFLAALVSAFVIAKIARRRQWHRKYLDYRVLAEGLRVQYYWAIAGVHGEGHTKFAYDNFLRQRDMELGWIRNVMRVAGTLSDAQPRTEDKEGLDFSICHWIGASQCSGQLDYYRRKAAERTRANRRTDAITLACFWGGVAVACVLAFYLNQIQPGAQDYLIIMMGILPLIAGVAEVYRQQRADRELTKQYSFMEHVFANARRRLDQAGSDSERREVLQGLGDAALSEHAEWILVHRARHPEPGGF